MSSAPRIQLVLLASDLLALAITPWLWWSSGRLPAMVGALVAVNCLIWLVVFFRLGLDGFRGGWSLSGVCSRNAAAVLQLAFIGGLVLVITAHLKWVPRWMYALGTSFCIVVITRCLAFAWVTVRWRFGHIRKAIIFGNGALATEVARKIDAHPELFCSIVGFLGAAGDPPALDLPAGVAAPASVSTIGIHQLMNGVGANILIVAISEINSREVVKLISQCRSTGIDVVLVPQMYDLYVSQPHLLNVDGLPLISMRDPHPTVFARAIKRVFDVCSATALLVLTSPLMLLAMLVLRLRYGRALRVEAAVGKDGRIFSMYSLNVERWSPDLSPFPAFLRQLRITELPQLISVVKGEMSMVGPRPASPDVVKHYSDWQKRRLRVKPGLTGLSQLRLVRPIPSLKTPHNIPPTLFRQDLEYVLDEGPLVDFALLLETPWTLVKRFMAAGRTPDATDAHEGQRVC